MAHAKSEPDMAESLWLGFFFATSSIKIATISGIAWGSLGFSTGLKGGGLGLVSLVGGSRSDLETKDLGHGFNR